jgi:hypothetical protein
VPSWPEDADGDVLRKLEEAGFDFSTPCQIEFDIDFHDWPPGDAALAALAREYPEAHVELFEPDEDGPGYVVLQVQAALTYELVTDVQARVTQLLSPYNGFCEAWGVLLGTTAEAPQVPDRSH